MSRDASPGHLAQAARPAGVNPRTPQALITGQGTGAEAIAEPGDAVGEECHSPWARGGLRCWLTERPAERSE